MNRPLEAAEAVAGSLPLPLLDLRRGWLEPVPDLDTRADLESLAALPRQRFAGERFPAKLLRYGYGRETEGVRS